MSKGGSKPSKPEMSESEKAQHAVAAAEWDHYKENYVPLENQYLKDSQKDFGDRARGQASSAVMREGTEAARLSALSGGTSRVADTVGSALTSANVEATHKAQQGRDGRMAGALGVGREIATDTSQNMSRLARSGARTSIGHMQNKLQVDMARDRLKMKAAKAVGEAAASGGAGGGGGPSSLSGLQGMSRSDYESIMGSSGSRQQDYRAMMR
jgi:hypothetical protein